MATKQDTPVIEFVAGNVKEATKGMKSSDTWQVPFDQIYVMPGFNVREHDEAYEQHVSFLAASIMENGYDRTKPMAGYIAEIDGVSRVVVTDGHSRYLAVQRARGAGKEIETVPFITAPRGTSMEDLTVALVTANSGRPLTPYETGTVIKRLISYGWDEKRIASKLRVTPGYVDDLLRLHEATKAIRDLVRTGKVAANTAIGAIKKHGTKATAVLQNAVKTATAAGKTKATAKHVAPTWKSACKAAGPDMYDLLCLVQTDPAYAKLDQGTRLRVDEMISGLPECPEE